MSDAPIGVFDSGVGGLTVLAALRAELPREDFVYLGDTARLPYGTKSAETVERYALQAATRVVELGVKCLVVACNTASAAALPAMRARFGALPIVGVVEPGAEAACAATRNGHIAVIATAGTVAGGAYQRAIAARRPDARVAAQACQVFVALAEEGWDDGEAVLAVARRYLEPLFARVGASDTPDALVLGCTHFPLLAAPIRKIVGPGVTIVDSAATTAVATRNALERAGLLRAVPENARSRVRFLATDGAARFASVGSRFLGEPLAADDVEIVDL